ncbi:MAG: hypothetical protein ABIC40_04795 [bacterium]
MDEQKIFALDLGGLFPEYDESLKVYGTAGEVLEQVADEWGLEEDKEADGEFSPDGVYPSSKAFKAHQLIEDQLGKSGAFADPDTLVMAMVRDGLARFLSDDEIDEWIDKEDQLEFEEARGALDEEWTDGLWES